MEIRNRIHILNKYCNTLPLQLFVHPNLHGRLVFRVGVDAQEDLVVVAQVVGGQLPPAGRGRGAGRGAQEVSLPLLGHHVHHSVAVLFMLH